MNATIKRRLGRLEAQKGIGKSSFKDKLITALTKYGFAAVSDTLAPVTEQGREMAKILSASVGADHLALEDYRGLVPDEVLQRAYSLRRNYTWGRNEVRARAGIIDAAGNVQPGYRFVGDLVVDEVATLAGKR